MVAPATRWNVLRQIMALRFGPGAAILPKDMTRIHLEFAHSAIKGHAGPQKFWRNYLPRLKYHNPALPMIVNRKTDPDSAATLSLYFRKPSAAATTTDGNTPSSRAQNPSSSQGASRAPEPSADEEVIRLDVKDQHQDAILALLVQNARGDVEPVEPSETEQAELAELAALRTQAERCRTGSLAERAARQEEAMQLERARKSAAVE